MTDMGSEEESRVTDFDEGVKAMECKDYDTAISNFQKCMKKLSKQGLGLSSELFPKCLQNISCCYNEKDDMENALSFKKFEKLYYETVLLHNGVDGLLMRENLGNGADEDQSVRDRGDGSSEASVDSSPVVSDNSSDTEENKSENSLPENQTLKRASEYEQLAKLCLQQECISLALEYSGKATLMYKHELGEDHEDTKKSYELFTSVYAEAGKKEYSDSMQRLNLDLPNNLNLPSTTSEVDGANLRQRRSKNKESEGDNEEQPKSLKRTRSILKKGTSANGKTSTNDLPTPDTPTRRVTFADPLPQMVRLRDDDETDDSSTNLLLFFLVCVLIILISLLISALFCHVNPTMGACVEFRRELTYYYHKLRYFYSSFFRN